jgi:hypothetical protein
MFHNEKGQKVNYNVYETMEVKLAKEFIKPNDFVLELGARYGGVSCSINGKLKDKTHQYSVEPDYRVWEALEKNKKNNNCQFNIIKGTISKQSLKIIENSRKFNDNNDWAAYTETGGDIPNFPLPDEPFNVLVADCEGFLETFYDENKSLFDSLRLIIIEKDRREYCNYDRLEKEFLNLGFQIVFKDRPDGFHTVYQKLVPLPPKILYINLDKRIDRRKHMEKLFPEAERVSAIEDEKGYIGCVKSHILCLKLAKGLKWKEVIILEDDFKYKDNRRLENMLIPKEYDMLLLSNLVKDEKDKEKYDDNFDRVYKAVWTSGHLVHQRFYDTLINIFEESLKALEEEYKHKNYLDVYWSKIFPDNLILKHRKIIGTQLEESFSDINNKVVKRQTKF